MAPTSSPDDQDAREEPVPSAPVAFGKYLLERRLAVGGSSEVYLARPRSGTEPAAQLVIKRLLPSYLADPSALGMFATEARLHRAIHHPNVVQVFEAGVVSGEPYLAMEYVDGVDAFRLARKSQSERRPIPLGVSIYLARSLAEALGAVHSGTDEAGKALGVVHRDVTPSNIYLSNEGGVLLGDFGIARAVGQKPSRQSMSAGLKGKYGYLSPEQVCGEPCDHRADIFSLAVVLSELILGQPLFPGSGQLAVLLAIRDGRIDALKDARSRLPLGLYEVIAKALARDPDARYATAIDFGNALSPYELPTRELIREELKGWISWARETPPPAPSQQPTPTPSGVRAVSYSEPVTRPRSDLDPPTTRRIQSGKVDLRTDRFEEEPVTARFDEQPSRVRFEDGRELSPVTFARVIQMIVTGELGEIDEVDLMGQGYKRVAAIELLERHLPDAMTTASVRRPSPPDETVELATTSFLQVLGRMYRGVETGLLVVEGATAPDDATARREVYLKGGTLFHIATQGASDLLGQSLVRRKIITQEELDIALAVLSKYEGRLGDTLIGLALVDPVDLFRAIEEQGKQRLSKVFAWQSGQLNFYRDVLPTRVEFPLELDLADLMLGGAEVAHPHDAPMILFRERLGHKVRRAPRDASPRRRAPLPRPITLLIDAIGGGMELRHVLMRLSTTRQIGAPDALRALEVAIALGVVELD